MDEHSSTSIDSSDLSLNEEEIATKIKLNIKK